MMNWDQLLTQSLRSQTTKPNMPRLSGTASCMLVLPLEVSLRTPGLRLGRVRSFPGIPFEKGHPTMPAPVDGGGVSVRPLSREEMKHWTRLLLKPVEVDIGDRRVTSHSCKCTLLSWCSKRGLPWKDRLALGGHTSTVKSAMVYSFPAIVCREDPTTPKGNLSQQETAFYKKSLRIMQSALVCSERKIYFYICTTKNKSFFFKSSKNLNMLANTLQKEQT